MSEERRKILDMLKDGKITAEEAEKLLAAIGDSPASGADAAGTESGKKRPRWLCIQVQPCCGEGAKGESVNIKVPLMLLRTGLKLGSVLPGSVKGKVVGILGNQGINVDLSNLSPKAVDELVDSLCELSINVDAEDENVRVFCV